MKRERMMKNGLVFGIIILFLLSVIPLTGSRSLQTTPSDLKSIDLTFDVPTVNYGMLSTDQGEFATIEIPNEGFTTTIGEARLPVMTRMVEIPQGAVPELSVTSANWKTTTLAEQNLPPTIYPVQTPQLKTTASQNQMELTMDPAAYLQVSFTPNVIATISDIGEIRGHRIATLQVFPVQYNPISEELNIMTHADINIALPGSDLALTSEMHERYASLAYTEMLQNSITNYESFNNGIHDLSRDQLGYLMIVYDSFYEEIQPLVSWKQNNGFTVTVTKTSQIQGGPTKENIKTYITTAYNQWSPPPSYVLLVGDTAQIPSWTGTQTGTCTDLYYVTITQPDYLPDIFVSRFPAATEAQVTIMVDKTLFYEQGSFTNSDWIKKGAFMASSDNYPVSEGTHNYVISTYLQPHGYTCDKLYCHTYGATTQQVRNALNNGRSLAIYSGHGSETAWADGPYFSQSDVNGLTNTNLYPFVCSHACLTGQFSYAECFGETWLRAPGKGGIAFWGASDLNYWGEDDILEKKMFSAWWDENLLTIGAMTDRAKILLYQNYGGGGLTKYYFEAYNVLGDSSVKIWREVPNTLMISGNCYYQDMSPVNIVSVDIINLNNGRIWQATTKNNYYSLQISPGRDVNASDTLRFIARDTDESVNITDHIVSTAEINAKSITQDLILNIHYRDLKKFPFYNSQIDTGAAIAQMMLNYLWWNSTTDPSGPPMHFADQTALFTAFNTQGGLYLNTDEMCQGLNAYRPLPVDQYGYFFAPYANISVNPVLQQICIWLDYPISWAYDMGYTEYVWPKPGYPNHVPIAIPTAGNYNNWMTIRGIHTNSNAWNYPDFPAVTVYGFWLNDPKTGGLGGNTYVTTSRFLSNYFLPLNVPGDTYNGQYLAITDPPEGTPINTDKTAVTVAPTSAGFTTVETKLIQITPKTGGIGDIANNIVIKTARNAVQNVLKFDNSDLFRIFAGTTVIGKPIYKGTECMVTFGNNKVTFEVQLLTKNGSLLEFRIKGL